jgi:hypothetical protein
VTKERASRKACVWRALRMSASPNRNGLLREENIGRGNNLPGVRFAFVPIFALTM